MRPQRLIRHGGPDPDPEATPVVALAHNEANILPAFLAHYRAICRPAFLIVDDRSDDGTAELLASAPDVTVFRPVEGSTYAEHKAFWRSELLDDHGADKWCLVPDLDEHFVFPGMGRRSLGDYTAALDREGAQAVVTLMLDLYADRPLAEHVFDPADGVSLAEAFPFFDGPGAGGPGYVMRPITAATRRRYPTPPVELRGGARERLFGQAAAPGPLARLVLRQVFSPDGPVNAGPAQALLRRLARPLAGAALRRELNTTKLGLIRWRRGMRFNGGAHKLDRAIPCSESIAVFLHYPFTRGREGLAYIAARGQHAGGAGHYAQMLEREQVLARSPVFEGSRRYTGPESLSGLMRDIPGG